MSNETAHDRPPTRVEGLDRLRRELELIDPDAERQRLLETIARERFGDEVVSTIRHTPRQEDEPDE